MGRLEKIISHLQRFLTNLDTRSDGNTPDSTMPTISCITFSVWMFFCFSYNDSFWKQRPISYEGERGYKSVSLFHAP